MEKTVLYCPNKYKSAKKHSLKARLGKDSKKAAHKKLPKMLMDYIYLTWEKHSDDRLLMNERQLKTTERGNFCCLWALWKVNGRENDLNITNIMGRNAVTDEIFLHRLLKSFLPKVQRLWLWPCCMQWGFGNQEIVIHYCSWCTYFAT